MIRLGFSTLCCAAGLLWLTPALGAQAPAEPGHAAVIDIEITIEGEHSSRGEAGESTEWRVLRHLALSYRLVAQPLSMASIGDTESQAQQTQQATALGQQGEQAITDNAGLMAQMQAAVEACGEDEACIQAYVMKLSQDPQLQAMSKDTAQVGQSAQAYVDANPPRFQQWQITGSSATPLAGQYKLDEWRKDVIYDPICYQTDNLCTTTRERKVEAKIDPSDPTAAGLPMVEVDTLKNTMTVVLTQPLFLPTIQQATQDGPQQIQIRFLPNDPSDYKTALEYLALPLTGSYADQTGERTVKLAQLDDYAAPVSMVLRWHFHAE